MAWMSEVRPPPGNFLSSGLLRSPATFANIKSSGIPRVRCYFSNYRGDLPDAPPLRSSNFSVVPRGSLGGLLLPNLVAKVFGPINFEASKLEVMFLGVEKDEHPEFRPRVYTLTHCDLTASLLLTISTSINTGQSCSCKGGTKGFKEMMWWLCGEDAKDLCFCRFIAT